MYISTASLCHHTRSLISSLDIQFSAAVIAARFWERMTIEAACWDNGLKEETVNRLN